MTGRAEQSRNRHLRLDEKESMETFVALRLHAERLRKQGDAVAADRCEQVAEGLSAADLRALGVSPNRALELARGWKGDRG